MSRVENYRIEYPGIPAEILNFFAFENAVHSENGVHLKRVQDFIIDYGRNHINTNVQPNEIVRICRRLVEHGCMSEAHVGGMMGLDNRYVAMIKKSEISLDDPSVIRLLDCMVYGPTAIYDHYAPSVLPLINWDKKENQQIGTCFVGGPHYVITALHCIKPSLSIALRGCLIEQLESAKFYSHPNEALDLAAIIFSEPVFQMLPSIPVPQESAQILDEVIAFGYPNVPGFHPTLAAEAASVSARLSITRGKVASTPSEIFSKAELFLITARVRGGFSGGPVLDPVGQAVGVISREPAADANSGEGHRYDDLGYGTAIPASHVLELIQAISQNKINPCNMDGTTFRKFE